jgi:hypothetical protein
MDIIKKLKLDATHLLWRTRTELECFPWLISMADHNDLCLGYGKNGFITDTGVAWLRLAAKKSDDVAKA